MKAKHVFLTLGLSLAMGLGVAASLVSSQEFSKAEATTKTLYCKMEYNWWTTSDAAIGVYAWDSSDPENTKNAAWPGVRMTAVGGQEHLWSASVDVDLYDKVIFTRVNGSGTIADWGAQTSDLDIPSVKNCYTITSDTAHWGGSNPVEGAWSVYPTVASEYHVLGSFNSWSDGSNKYRLTVDASNANHYSLFGVSLTKDDELKVCDVPNDDWYGNGGSNVVVPETGKYIIDFFVEDDGGNHVLLTKQVQYSLKNGMLTYNFVLDESGKDSGVLHQYSIIPEYAYRASELEIYADDTKLTSNIGVDYEDGQPKPGNNIVGDVESGFKFYSYQNGVKVYLKTYRDGGRSLWGMGYEENEYYCYIKDGEGNVDTVYLYLDPDFTPDGTYIKQYKTDDAVELKALAGTEWETCNSLDCGGVAEDFTVENVSNNNARQNFQSTAWSVHNDCTEVIYLKMKADLSLWMFVGGYEEEHVLSIGGKNVTLNKYDENQYRATGVALSAGDTVTSFTIEDTVQAVTSKVVGNNNLAADLSIIADVASADIYYNVNTHTLFVSGLPNSGYHILKNNRTIVQMIPTDPFDDYQQFKSEKITFAVNDTFQFIDVNASEGDGNAVIWTIGIINAGGLGANFEVVKDGSDNPLYIKCKTACEAAVYMKLKSGLDEIYFGTVAEWVQEAINYANGFKSAMQTACGAAEKKDAVENAWGLQATAYAGLSEKAQGELKLGLGSSQDEIKEFYGRYVAIKAQHSTWTLSDFMSWVTPANHVNAVRINNNALIITLVSVSTLVASGALVLFLLKKKKYSK